MDELKWPRPDKCEITCLTCNNKFSVQNGEEEINWSCPVCKVNRRLVEAEGWLRQFNTCLSLQDMTKLLRAVHKFLYTAETSSKQNEPSAVKLLKRCQKAFKAMRYVDKYNLLYGTDDSVEQIEADIADTLKDNLTVVRKDDLNEALLRLLSAYTPGGQHKEYGDEDWFNRLNEAIKEE